jgi:hypothetical protein
MSAIEAFWLIMFNLVYEVGYISLIGLLALYLWNFSVVGSVRLQAIALRRSSSQSQQTTLEVALGDLFRADVLALLAYTTVATLIFTFYYMVILQTKKSSNPSEDSYDELISSVYMFHMVLMCGSLAFMMLF